jgi:hypothetical protein
MSNEFDSSKLEELFRSAENIIRHGDTDIFPYSI